MADVDRGLCTASGMSKCTPSTPSLTHLIAFGFWIQKVKTFENLTLCFFNYIHPATLLLLLSTTANTVTTATQTHLELQENHLKFLWACQWPLSPSKLVRLLFFFRSLAGPPPSNPWFRILILPPPWGGQKLKPAQALGSGHGFVHMICRELASWEITISSSKNMHDVFFYNCLVNYSLILTLMSEIAWLKIFLSPSTLKITENYWKFICIHTEGLKPQPEASKNQSPGPRPCETLAMALVAWARLSRLTVADN